MNREIAVETLKKYNKVAFHIRHAYTVEGVMRWFANELGYADEADFWATVGLLHDVDFENWPEEHCVKAPELLREAGFDDRFIHAVCSHAWADHVWPDSVGIRHFVQAPPGKPPKRLWEGVPAG